jgi:hypothetical protein
MMGQMVTNIETIVIALVASDVMYHHQASKSLTVFCMLHVFLQLQKGNHQQRLCQQTEVDGLCKPKAWKVAPEIA